MVDIGWNRIRYINEGGAKGELGRLKKDMSIADPAPFVVVNDHFAQSKST